MNPEPPSPTSSLSPSPEEPPRKRLIDPYIKSAEYLQHERLQRPSAKRHRRSRSRSRSHRHSRRHRRRYSSSSSSDRSSSRRRHSHRRSRRSRSRSRTRRRRSRSRSRSRRRREPSAEAKRPTPQPTSDESEDDDEEPVKENAFKNDGSFLEMFKKMQEEKSKEGETAAGAAPEGELIKEGGSKTLPCFGKRRGGKVLKTGVVQKSKIPGQEDEEEPPQDAWSIYMREVRRYKEACCDDDSKTRPLVK